MENEAAQQQQAAGIAAQATMIGMSDNARQLREDQMAKLFAQALRAQSGYIEGDYMSWKF
jgi:hypothetical protein